MRYINAFPVLAVAILACGIADAANADETFDLRDVVFTTRLSRVRVQLDISGKLRTMSNGKLNDVNLTVSGKLGYDEQRFAARGKERVSLRHYDQCHVIIRVGDRESRPKLRPSRQRIAVRLNDDQATLFSPNGPLTRDELDLIDIPGNTAVLPKLLPGEKVKRGATWKVDADSLALLLCLDAVSASDVQCVLRQVTPEKTAKIELAGHVDGAIHGVASEIHLKGRFEYDLKSRRIRSLDLTIHEIRGISHVGPGLDVTATLKLSIDELKSSPHFPSAHVGKPPTVPDAGQSLLTYVSEKGGFQFLCSRRWHLVHEHPKMVALRLVQHGELIAQCNISPVTPDKSNRPLKLEAFRDQVRKALGKSFRNFTSQKNGTTKAGLKSAVFVVDGEAESLAIRWIYYLLTDESGRQLAVVFTVERSLADQLGSAGERLVDHVRLMRLPAKKTGKRHLKTIRVKR